MQVFVYVATKSKIIIMSRLEAPLRTFCLVICLNVHATTIDILPSYCLVSDDFMTKFHKLLKNLTVGNSGVCMTKFVIY